METKWIALIALVIQNSGLALVMRYTLFSMTDDRYSPSTAVFLSEVLKVLISVVSCFVFDSGCSYSEFTRILNRDLIEVDKMIWFKLAIPSLLYTLQNSLQYYSMSLLSAPVFQVLYQMKIITTALFSVAILSKKISSYQWASVLALTAGVALVQLSQLKSDGASRQNSILGILSVALGCITSGYAGVYFESILKSYSVSIWVRNIQLGVIGAILSSSVCYVKDFDVIVEKGFLHGYNEYVYLTILLAAAGGLIVAVVVKYADNILKGFATSLSILLSCGVSAVVFFDVDFNRQFVTGAMIVLLAVFGYGYSPQSPPSGGKAVST